MDKELQSIDEFDVYNVETNNIQKGYSTDSNDNINIRGINDVLPERLDGGSFALKPVDDSDILEAVGVKGFAKGFGSGVAQFGGQLYFGGKAVGTGLLGATAETGLKLGNTITGSRLLDNLGVDRQQFDEFTKEASSIIDEKTKDIQHNYFIQNDHFKNRIAEEFNLKGTTSENIGAGFGSVFTAIGTNFLFGAPAVLASFGLSQGSETFMKAREKGMTNLESLLYGTATGTGEAVLEEVGLQLFAGGIAKRGIYNFVKGTLSEGIEEAQQTFASETIEKLAGIDEKGWGEILKDSAISLWYTVIGAGIMGGVSKVAIGKGRNAFAKKLMETAGLSEEEAYKVADKVEEHSRENFEENSNSVLNSQLDLDKFKDRDYENVVGRTKQIMDEVIAGKRQVEETRHNAVVDLVDRNTNLSQEDKDLTVAMLEANFLANEEIFGDSFEEQLESKKGRFGIQTEAEPMDRLAFDEDENTYVNEAGQLVDKTTGQVLFQQEQQEYNLPDIDIDGVKKPALNSEGNYLGKTEEEIRNFYKWFGDSKVVDEEGKPLVVYHGTTEKFDEFNKEKIGEGSGNYGHYGYGFYFTPYKNYAKSYGETGDYYLSIKNPFIPNENNIKKYSKFFELEKTKPILDKEKFENLVKQKDAKAYELLQDIKKYGYEKGWDIYGEKNGYEDNILDLNFIVNIYDEEYSQSFDGLSEGTIERLNNQLGETPIKYDYKYIPSLASLLNLGQYEGQVKEFSDMLEKDGYDGVSVGDEIVAFNPNQIKSVENKGTYSPDTGNIYYQSAYAGSRVDYDRPSLEAIGSGEGNQAHGYGLYYALDRGVAEEYRRSFMMQEMNNVVFNNKTYNKDDGNIGTALERVKKEGKENTIKFYEELVREFPTMTRFKENLDMIKSLSDEDVKNIDIKTGQVHEVDIPENFVLLDEQKKITKQYAKVKKGIIEAMKEAGLEHFTSVSSLSNFTGKEMYEKISHTLGSDKQASELLAKHGIKGITYFGSQDGRCFVIFNPDDVQVVNKFYQKEQEQQDIRGQIDTAKNLINIFKSGDRDTLIHELNHMFSLDRINLAISKNRLDTLNPLFKHFGLEATIENAEKLKETYYQEEIATMAVNYFTTNEAPSTGLRKYFQNLKEWAQSVWENLTSKGLVKREELSPDIVEFFDSLYSRKEIDVESVAKAREQVRQLVKDIKAGKAVNIENINIDEVYRLLDAKNRRIPRAPKNLRQALVSAGGISNTLAESLDLKELMGEQDKKYSRLFTDDGKIKNENQLVEFLKSNGFMASEEAKTDAQVGSEFDRAMNLLENAEDVYSEKDAQALAMRENTLQAVEEANQLLDALGVDAEEVMQHIQELKKSDITAVSKSEVKQLDNKIKELEKEYKKLNKEVIKSTKENMQEMRDKVVDFIRAQKIDSEDKAKLITKVKQANTEYMLDKTLNEIAEKSKEYYEKEQKTILANAIEKELKKTKAKDVKNQKYLYEDNKLFNNLRNYSKMTQAEAEIELSKFMGKEDLTYDEQLEKLYLSYKANGKDDTSVDLMNELLDTIRYTKLQSKQAKDEKEFLDYLNRKENKDEMIHGVRTRKVTGGFEKGVARFVNGLNSMLRFVAGKDVAEKYNFENLETQKNIKTFNFYEAQAKESMDIFGFKKMGDLLNKIQEMRKKVATLSYYDEKLGQGKYDLTKMDIIDLYNDYKNTDTKKAMDNIYGEAQIREFIDMLTDEEKEFGDSLQKYVNERYEETNKVFVKAYQTDLPKIENYWPRTSERTTNETDAFDTFKKPSETPSQLKERKKGNVIVKPMDAYSKFQNHIESSFYLTEMALPYKELSETINSMRVKNEITNKFDDKVYKDLKELVDNLSYSEYFAYRKKDLQSGMYDKILNNWVSAKIGGLAPTVFVKQLLSATNYATEMGYKNWAKGIFEYFKNPKQAKKFMQQYVGDYLKQRYKTGYNDAMSRVKEDAGNTPKVIPANIKSGLMDAITWMTRTGDISAIIYGGYPRLKQLINSGMSEEEAVKTWITETERAQQSRTMANQSRFQHNRAYRLISNFKNTPIQYMRKINDTIVGYMNGDISKDVAIRTLFNYAVIQPVLLGMVTALMYNITAPDDKDKSYLDETIKALIMQFFNPVGGVSDVASAFVDTMQGNRVYDMQTPAFGEMVQAVKKLQKKNKDAFDYTEIILPFIEATTGAPISRTEKQIKALVR